MTEAEQKRVSEESRIPVNVGGWGWGGTVFGGMFSGNPVVAIQDDSAMPTDEELRAIRDAIPTTFMRIYNPEFVEQVMAQPLPVVEGHNTVLLYKGGEGSELMSRAPGWHWRRASWSSGPSWLPYPWPEGGASLDEVLAQAR